MPLLKICNVTAVDPNFTVICLVAAVASIEVKVICVALIGLKNLTMTIQHGEIQVNILKNFKKVSIAMIIFGSSRPFGSCYL